MAAHGLLRASNTVVLIVIGHPAITVALESPVPFGQKRNYLERNVETYAILTEYAELYTGARPARAARSPC